MKKNLLALLIGAVMSLLLLLSFEFFFRLNEKFSWWTYYQVPPITQPGSFLKSHELYKLLGTNEVYKWQPLIPRWEAEDLMAEGQDNSQKLAGHHRYPQDFLESQTLSFRSKVFTAKSKRLIYSAQFTLDPQGRRITPVRPEADYNIVMMGDSFTLGEGVDDNQTAAYQLGLMRPRAQVYNLGVPGGSPNDILYELTTDPFRLDDLPAKPSIFIYTYIDDHFERLMARSSAMEPESHWILEKPYYAWENNQVTFKGFFESDRPLTNAFYSFWNQSALLRFFDISWPPRFGAKDFEFFGEVLKEMQKIVAENYHGEFYLAFFPGTNIHGPALKKVALQKNIPILDYIDLELDRIADDKAYIPVDRHPSPVGQFIFAYLLDRDLPKK